MKMKISTVFSALILAGSVLVAADKRRLCTEVCWTHYVHDQNCPDNCFASPRPTEEEATLTGECMIECTTKFISSLLRVDMKGYAECRSGCYNKYFSLFLDTYQSGINKQSIYPESEVSSTRKIQLALDCSSLCSSNEVWPVFGSANSDSCLKNCFKGGLSNSLQFELGIDKLSMIGKTAPSGDGSASDTEASETTAIVSDNQPILTDSYDRTMLARKNKTFAFDSDPTDNVTQRTRTGEVNGALAWAESAYHSFWLFAWALMAIAIAIGTQMF